MYLSIASLSACLWSFNFIWMDLDMKITSCFYENVFCKLHSSLLTPQSCSLLRERFNLRRYVHCGVCVNCYTKLIYLWAWFSLFLSACSADDANMYQHRTSWFSLMERNRKMKFITFRFRLINFDSFRQFEMEKPRLRVVTFNWLISLHLDKITQSWV